VNLRTLLSFDGRVGRGTFWLVFVLPYMGGYLVLLVVDNALGTVEDGGEIGLLSGLFVLATLYPYLAGCVKRYHDRDKSGWWLLLSLIPLVNLWVTVELGFLAGTPGPNRFGPPDEESELVDPAALLKCPACATVYNPADYRRDAAVIYCSACKAPLPQQP